MKLKKILPLLLVGIMTLSPITASASDIDITQSEINSLQTSLTDISNEITSLDGKIKEKDTKILELDTEIKNLENQSNTLSDSITLRDTYLKELKSKTNYKELLSNSKTHSDLLDKMSQLKDLIKTDESEIQKMSTKIDTINSEKTNIENDKKTLITSKTDSENKKNNIQNQINEKQSIIDEYNRQQELKKQEEALNNSIQTSNPSWNGSVLSASAGVNYGPTGKETYYNLDMSGVVSIMRSMGNNDEYWIRGDGCKMLGNYIMVAANLNVFPRGSLVETSLGTGIVCDTGGFASGNATQLDIATTW